MGGKYLRDENVWEDLKGVISINQSFETNEQGTQVIYFPFAVRIDKIRTVVLKALAATDNGTVTPKNNAGTAMTGGAVTITASAAIGDEDSAAPTANNTIAAGEKMQLTTAKTTAGGKIVVTIEYTRT